MMNNQQKKIDDERNTGHDKEYLKGVDLSNKEDVERSKTPLINEQLESFKFMQIDVDYYTANGDEIPCKNLHLYFYISHFLLQIILYIPFYQFLLSLKSQIYLF